MHMVKIDDKVRKEICKLYLKGYTIVKLSEIYHIGDRRVKKILKDGSLEINNPHRRTSSTDDYIEKKNKQYPLHDGYRYVAVLNSDNSIVFDDYLNKSGTLISYIKNTLGVEIPTLFKRKKYFHDNGKQWYENFFNIIEIPLENTQVKKCPYCDWVTKDVENRSGMYLTHLSREHGIDKLSHLKKHPEDREYLVLVNESLDRKMETDKKKFVTCAICGEKFGRLDWRHFAKHGITKEQYISKYGVENLTSEDTRDKLSKVAIQNNMNMKPTWISKPELELRKFLEDNDIDYIGNDRKLLKGKELDIYIPSIKFAIEYHGLFWHKEDMNKKDKNSHLLKLNLCKEQGVKLVQIFEDEYINNREIVYNKLKHLLKINSFNKCKRIPGRKCIVKEIDKKLAKTFLDKNHIQNSSCGTIFLGAYYEDILVAVMSFKKMVNNTNNWELARFASDYHFICQGVGGKLFKYFIKNYSPEYIKSFADRRWTVDEENNIYIQLGFKFDSYTNPDYSYYSSKIDKYHRLHKFGFRKQILHNKYGFPLTMTENEMTEKLGCTKVWNAGLIKYVWKNEEK